jgi:hypothetical protein
VTIKCFPEAPAVVIGDGGVIIGCRVAKFGVLDERSVVEMKKSWQLKSPAHHYEQSFPL